MFNRKIAKQAEEARKILEAKFFGFDWSLPSMARGAVEECERLEALCGRYHRELSAANAKIARMTSGLKRGSRKAA